MKPKPKKLTSSLLVAKDYSNDLDVGVADFVLSYEVVKPIALPAGKKGTESKERKDSVASAVSAGQSPNAASVKAPLTVAIFSKNSAFQKPGNAKA